MALYSAPEYDPTKPGPMAVTPTQFPDPSAVIQATPEKYDASQISVNPESTVSHQLSGLLSQGSRYVDQARANAAEVANQRGMLNSSMAAGAGEKAAIESALPIAQQDAQTYGQSQLANQQATNAALSQNAQLGTQANLTNAEAQNRIVHAQTDLAAQQQLAQQQASLQSQLQGEAFNQQLGTLAADTQSKAELMGLDADIRERLAATQQEYALQLEELSQSYEVMKNLDTSMATMYDGALRSISNVLADPDMSTEQSTNAIKVIIDNLGAGLEFLSGVTSQPAVVDMGGNIYTDVSAGSGEVTGVTANNATSTIDSPIRVDGTENLPNTAYLLADGYTYYDPNSGNYYTVSSNAGLPYYYSGLIGITGDLS